MTTANTAEFEKHFRRYLAKVQSGGEVVILENNKEIARLVPHQKTISPITASLIGVLKNDYDEKAMHEERIKSRDNMLCRVK